MTDIRKKLGQPSGSLIHMGREQGHDVEISVMDYNEEFFKEFKVEKPEELKHCLSSKIISWINVDGIHDPDTIQAIGEQFNLHPLLLEDVMNPNHRPKIEEFDKYIHFTLKMLAYNHATRDIEMEQVSFVLGDSWVISFQETPGDVFDTIRERIRNGKGRIRKNGSDYLAYALSDIIVDHYFIIVDELDEDIDRLEHAILNEKNIEVMKEIQRLKKQLMSLRKSIIPVRDAVGNLMKGTSNLIDDRTTFYLKDVYDHTLYLTDSIEVYREMLNSLMEVHLSSLSNRLNNVMKVLTIISTIFIPLTFIVGVYGMNFKVMPEIDWKYGYLSVWILMITVTLVLIIILKRKKWM
ncbi:MAG: magnesium/cobalt transporter CorA [Flavobacteriales bacterium]|nr:magnesium/cobalt transporter CorA [Flavobacteriales bacterium]